MTDHDTDWPRLYARMLGASLDGDYSDPELVRLARRDELFTRERILHLMTQEAL